MVWFKFLLCVVIILFAGTKLARTVLAGVRTGNRRENAA